MINSKQKCGTFILMLLLMAVSLSMAQQRPDGPMDDEARRSREQRARYFFDNLYRKRPNGESPAHFAERNFIGAMELGHICSLQYPLDEKGVAVTPDPERLPESSPEFGATCQNTELLSNLALKSTSRAPEKISTGGWVDTVGRLDLYTKDDKQHHLWATAFVIASNGKTDLLATSCHGVESLLQQDSTKAWKLAIDPAHELRVNYGYRTADFARGDSLIVSSLRAYSENGLDVVFLEAEHHKTGDVPLRLGTTEIKLATSEAEEAKKIPKRVSMGLFGYPDFLHPVDPLFEESYGPYKTFGWAKFVSIGSIGGTDGSFLEYDASTTVGQSGSPVVAVWPIVGGSLEVVGVHVCCTAYWWEEQAPPPPSDYEGLCGVLTREPWNKAVSSYAILKDKRLCKALQDYDHTYKCPN